MKKHLKSIAKDLISQNPIWDSHWERFHNDQEKLLRELKGELVRPVKQMDAEKLGRIFFGFEDGDTDETLQEMTENILAKEMGPDALRDLVTAGLAYIVRTQLNNRHARPLAEVSVG